MERFAVLLVLLTIACTDAERATDPVWGKQPCGACAMLVSDPNTAAQLLTKEGEHLFFDDLGCMLSSAKYSQAKAVWVHTRSGQWVDARTAHYGPGATPMDYGYVVSEQGTDLASVERAIAARREHP